MSTRAARVGVAAARRSAVTASSAVRLAVRRRAAEGGVVLGYHDVVGAGEEASGWTVSADVLAAHIRVLRRLGLRVVPLDELVAALLAGRPTDRMAAITFDDALVGVYRHALPVLIECAAPATVFVVTGTVGDLPPWWPGAQRTMRADELAELANHDIALEAHTRTHASLPGCDPATLRAELAGAREDLAGLSGHAPQLLAYPFGHHGPEVRRAAAEAGYHAACTFLNGRITPGTDPFRIPRFAMRAELGATRLALWLGRSCASWGDHQANVVLAGGPRSHSGEAERSAPGPSTNRP